MKNHYGFTLIELLATLAIVAIVTSLAIPAFTSVIISNQLTSYTNEFVTTLNFARSEAIKRGYKIVVRRNGGSDDGWETGWRVFIDYNKNNAFDDDTDNVPCEAAVGSNNPEDCELKVSSGLPSPFMLRGDGNLKDYITYNTKGMNNMQGSFMLCNDKDGSHRPKANMSRLISINRLGRLRIAKDTNNDGIPNTTDTGNPNVKSCISPFDT